MSAWRDHDVPGLVRDILRMVGRDETYGSGRAFLTAYQLAIEFSERHPQIAQAITPNVAGRGEGPYALSVYLARQLPDHIRSGEIPDMEVRFLDSRRITKVAFDRVREATTLGEGQAFPIFRLTD
jgi:hypothetical protein